MLNRSLIILTLLALLLITSVRAAPGLPDDFDPDPAIPSPAEVLGFEPGEWHPRHDQIVTYLTRLAEASDRVTIEQIGRTHGLRPLLLLTFASPERQVDLDQLRADRQRASRAGDGPAVAWLGYSVHGNEASGASAALITAWYLAADRGPTVSRWLDEMVIVMEPALNPDGLDRFAHWVNMHRGRHPSADPDDREHNESWPSGRTNYYWFDLNRDWLPLVHPESRARASALQQWQPHVLTDHHEMGTNSTFFFQPGVPERTNPLTPEANQTLTARIAEYHGRILDQAGQPYYSRESFDDYYLGKGSTYPDLTGGLGILFEQASSRGHVQESDYGLLGFDAAIANQVRTSLSTLTAVDALADDLISYQQRFFETARDAAGSAGHAGWVLADDGDPVRARKLIDLLLAHGVTVQPADEAVTVAGTDFAPGSAWVIPAAQDHYRLLASIFDPVTELPMETFYDVSAWPLAQAYDLPLTTTRRLPSTGDALTATPSHQPRPVASSATAWLVPWNQYGAPALLAALLNEGYLVQAGTEAIETRTDAGRLTLPPGSLVVSPGLQPADLPAIGERLNALSSAHGVDVLSADSGLSLSGPDLGSPSVPVLTNPKPALLTGDGLNSYHAGYIWHWFDTRLEQPLTLLDHQRLNRADLGRYTHLILPEGNYNRLPESVASEITAYVRGGGIVMAARDASAWVESLDLGFDFVEQDDEEEEDKTPLARRSYADFSLDFARTLIGGSALTIELDTSHPLAWGYQRDTLTVFRRGRHLLQESDNAYVHAGVYAENPLASGYLSEDTIDRLSGTPALVATRHGSGTVVRMADDYLFRGYWLGAERLFANALFFSDLINRTELPDE